jgi:hypothetical protein
VNNGSLAVSYQTVKLREYLDNADIAKGPFMSANDRQVSGNHYKTMTPDIPQHWDIVAMHNLDYFQGQITKYVMRWKNKNGLQDLEKAKHFLEKYIELQQPKEEKGLDITLKDFADWDEFYTKQGSEPTSDEYLTENMKWANEVAKDVTGIPDHLKEFVPTDRQKEVAAKFEDLREKHMNAISPMMQRILEDKEWNVDAGEPMPNGYVNQDK